MRDLQEIYAECVQECKDAGIPIRDDRVLSIEIGKEEEMINDYGLCYPNKLDLTFEIHIIFLLLDENYPLIELKDTIIHELIHTCSRCGIHGKTWMKYAKIMNEKYGYELTTFKDDDAIFHSDKPILHHCVCPDCGSLYNERTEEEKIPNSYIQCPFCRFYYQQID